MTITARRVTEGERLGYIGALVTALTRRAQDGMALPDLLASAQYLRRNSPDLSAVVTEEVLEWIVSEVHSTYSTYNR